MGTFKKPCMEMEIHAPIDYPGFLGGNHRLGALQKEC